EEDRGPNDPEAAEDLKRLPPAVRRHAVGREPRHDGGDERWRERATPSRAEPRDGLRAGALALRQPDCENLREIGEAARLAGAEHEARHQQRGIAPGPTRGRGEEGPPDNDSGEDLARTDPVPEKTAGDLERGVRPVENQEDPAQLFGCEMKGVGNRWGGNRNAHPVDVRNDRERDGEYNHPISNVGGAFYARMRSWHHSHSVAHRRKWARR